MPAARAFPPIRPSATAAAFLPSSVVTSSISPVAILAIMTARAVTSAGRFSSFGPFGICATTLLLGGKHRRDLWLGTDEMDRDHRIDIIIALLGELGATLRSRSEPEYLYTAAAIAGFGAVSW